MLCDIYAAFDASQRGKKGLKSSRDKNARNEASWGGGRACFVTPDQLRLGGGEKRRAKIINEKEKEKEQKKNEGPPQKRCEAHT